MLINVMVKSLELNTSLAITTQHITVHPKCILNAHITVHHPCPPMHTSQLNTTHHITSLQSLWLERSDSFGFRPKADEGVLPPLLLLPPLLKVAVDHAHVLLVPELLVLRGEGVVGHVPGRVQEGAEGI